MTSGSGQIHPITVGVKMSCFNANRNSWSNFSICLTIRTDMHLSFSARFSMLTYTSYTTTKCRNGFYSLFYVYKHVLIFLLVPFLVEIRGCKVRQVPRMDIEFHNDLTTISVAPWIWIKQFPLPFQGSAQHCLEDFIYWTCFCAVVIRH